MKFIKEVSNAKTLKIWFFNLEIQYQNKTDSNLPSRLEIGLLLDGGASILVLKIPTYMMVTQMFIVSKHDQHDTSRTLSITTISDVPNIQYISVT